MKKLLLIHFLNWLILLICFTDEHSGFNLVASAKYPWCAKQSHGWQIGHVLSEVAAGGLACALNFILLCILHSFYFKSFSNALQPFLDVIRREVVFDCDILQSQLSFEYIFCICKCEQSSISEHKIVQLCIPYKLLDVPFFTTR